MLGACGFRMLAHGASSVKGGLPAASGARLAGGERRVGGDGLTSTRLPQAIAASSVD